MIKQEIAPGVWQEAEPIKFQTGCFWKVLALVVPAIALALCLLLCSCATPDPWQQERELQAILPAAEIALDDIPAPVAAEIVRAFRDAGRRFPSALRHIRAVKSDYALSRKSSFPREYYAVTNVVTAAPVNSIMFNDAHLQSLGSVRAQYMGDAWKGYHVAVPRGQEMYAVTLHELAHVLTANLRLQNDPAIIWQYQLFQADAAQGRCFASNGRLNIVEFVAECFVDGMCNGGAAQGISKAVLTAIEAKQKEQI